MNDRTDQQITNDLLREILGELKVMNEIARTKVAFEPRPVDNARYTDLLEVINSIRLEHRP